MLFILLVLAAAAAATSDDPIVGHIVAHSHNDVGWLLTINGYYDTYVHSIYNTVIEALSANHERKFISVEMAYFSMWWGDASDTQKEAARKVELFLSPNPRHNRPFQLVQNGQLEFVIGGWTMEDEACTTYSANIDEMTLGHQFIVSLFGEGAAPRYGWQIDPFGHSNVAHAHFALMGFNATVLDRIQYELKACFIHAHTGRSQVRVVQAELTANRSLELIWETNANVGADSEACSLHARVEVDVLQIFTHIMDAAQYGTAVGGLEWDDVFSNPAVNDSNILALATSIVDNILQRRSYGATNQVLFPWGNDFQHYFALIAFINKNTSASGVRVQYSTLSDYFEAVAAENVTFNQWPAKDWFPYNDGAVTWWTGYYTSRVALKGFTRVAENTQRTAELLHALTLAPWGLRNEPGDFGALDSLRRASAEVTHHDAVSGTAQPWVVIMYDDHLKNGSRAVENVLADGASKLGQTSATDAPSFAADAATMESLLSGEGQVAIAVFNPTSWTMDQFVQAPCYQTNLVVSDADGNVIPFDVLPAVNATAEHCMVAGVCGYPNVSAPYTLFFEAVVPALGQRVYFVSINESVPQEVPYFISSTVYSITNSQLQLNFDEATGLLSSITNFALSTTATVSQTFMEYPAYPNMTNGDYIFDPLGPAVPLVPKPMSYEVTQGRFVSQVRQVFTPSCRGPSLHISCGVEQVYRLYTSAAASVLGQVEILTSAGPLQLNREFVSRYSTSLETNGVFYTDDNCFDTHERSYNPDLPNAIGGNYYPLTCSGFIVDSAADRQLTFITDRTHGATSQSEGQFEIMYHRRLFSGAPLNLDDSDNVQNIRTLMLFGETQASTQLRRQLQYNMQYPATLFYQYVSAAEQSWTYASNYSALRQPMPLNVHVVSLLQLNSSFAPLLLRLAHIYEVGEDPVLSQPVTVALADYFNFASIVEMTERTLTAIHDVSYLQGRMGAFRRSGGSIRRDQSPDDDNQFNVTLTPSQIRTFFVTLTSP